MFFYRATSSSRLPWGEKAVANPIFSKSGNHAGRKVVHFIRLKNIRFTKSTEATVCCPRFPPDFSFFSKNLACIP